MASDPPFGFARQVLARLEWCWVRFGLDQTLSETCLIALAIFGNREVPTLFLIPSTVWRTPDKCFANRDFPGRKTPPEWGIDKAHRVAPQGVMFGRIEEQIRSDAPSP